MSASPASTLPPQDEQADNGDPCRQHKDEPVENETATSSTKPSRYPTSANQRGNTPLFMPIVAVAIMKIAAARVDMAKSSV